MHREFPSHVHIFEITNLVKLSNFPSTNSFFIISKIQLNHIWKIIANGQFTQQRETMLKRCVQLCIRVSLHETELKRLHGISVKLLASRMMILRKINRKKKKKKKFEASFSSKSNLKMCFKCEWNWLISDWIQG